MLRALLLFSIVITAAHARYIQFFRKDYQYIEKYDAFYKMHWSVKGMNWNSAFSMCEEEDSRLFYPSLKDEWLIIKNLTNQLKEEPNVTDIFLGVHDIFALGEFITIDGQSTPIPLFSDNEAISNEHHCVVMDIETGTSKAEDCESQDVVRPFVCKKTVTERQHCPTVDKGYIYSKNLKKCYKVNNNRQKTWKEAMDICYMEGGILVVINEIADVQLIPDIQDKEYFIGFRKMFGDTKFYTVRGQSIEGVEEEIERKYLENHGYYAPERTHACGTLVVYENRFGSNNCYEKLPFICEMEANP